MKYLLLLMAGALFTAGCARDEAASPAATPHAGAEAVSFLGDSLRPTPLPAATRQQYEAELAEAEARLEAHPDSVEAWIWVGRRMAYLGRYRDAIDIFSRAMDRFPDDARLYRHRGHRYITVREIDNAIADFENAVQRIAGREDEVEPDGRPNERNTPTSTLQSNIWYHLGLAHYLRGDFESALPAYREAMNVSRNPDMLVATSHWLYMTLRRLGREAEARAVIDTLHAGMDIIENRSYLRLILMYKGELPADSLVRPSANPDAAAAALDDATTGYGVGNWHLYNGRTAEAERIFRQVIAGPQWPSFGYIAAEAELARPIARRR